MKKIAYIALVVIAGTIFMSSQVLPQKKKKNAVPEEIKTNINGTGQELKIVFNSGPEHNHPLMAIWLETMDGEYIQSVYVAESIAKGFFSYGDKSSGKWQPGVLRRPAALPYWGHQRGIQANDGLYLPTTTDPLPDAYSGATPKGDFILNTKADEPIDGKFRVLFESNQSWDWNEYWTNNKYPEDVEYKTSSQPSVIYAVTVDPASDVKEYTLNPVGHGHYAGADGVLYTDLSTLTTALKIVESIRIVIE
ncbi:MAG: hypothetical protein C0593_13240 [Marinilabiliales bacterium]|nr:MAG: hypothetical protein C0593_13240 [Marinilabiliales bacterium]